MCRSVMCASNCSRHFLISNRPISACLRQSPKGNVMHLDLFAGRMSRGTERSAGFDLFSAEPERKIIQPGERGEIRVGVRTRFDAGYVALLWDKSGYARKLGVTILGGMIE